MTGNLVGRTAIVAGASRGIGLAIATSLVEAGANVVVTSRRRAAAEAAAAALGERARGFEAHATDESAAAACVEFALSAFGSLDILVNNAGINPSEGPVVHVDRSRFLKTLEVNLWAPLLWTGLAWRMWMEQHGGVVINTASLGGLVASRDLGVYSTSKAGLLHLTRHLALELAPNVRVNALAPGVVRTRLAEALWMEHEAQIVARTPLSRIGETHDVAALAVFLASDEASWITGATFVIDGGQSLASRTTP